MDPSTSTMQEQEFFLSPRPGNTSDVLRLHFPASNNVAEYEACFHGLRIAIELGIKRLLVYGDLAIVINQLNKDWDTTNRKWMLTTKPFLNWKANSMASSTPMWSGTKTKCWGMNPC